LWYSTAVLDDFCNKIGTNAKYRRVSGGCGTFYSFKVYVR
jgi:hypothetical protein